MSSSTQIDPIYPAPPVTSTFIARDCIWARTRSQARDSRIYTSGAAVSKARSFAWALLNGSESRAETDRQSAEKDRARRAAWPFTEAVKARRVIRLLVMVCLIVPKE